MSITPEETQDLAAAIARELKRDSCCPLGVSQEQADTVKEIVTGYNAGKKALLRVIGRAVFLGLLYLVVAVIGFEALMKIFEYLKRF